MVGGAAQRYVMKNADIVRNIIRGTFLVSLIVLAPHSAIAQQEPNFNHTGAVAYIQGGDLWVKELPEGEAKQLTSDGDITNPRWSSSGQWLAYLKEDRLWVVQRSGAGGGSLERGGPVGRFAWSPTSDTLAYRSHSGSLWVVSASDWVEQEIVSNPKETEGTGVWNLTWNPDGEWMAYEWREGLTYQGLWRISADGREATELYVSGVPEKGVAVLAGWSGDGRFLLFWQGDILSASMLADGVPLYAVPAGGGTPVRLADAVLVYSGFIAAQPAGGEQVAVIAGGHRGAWTNKALRIVLPVSGEGETLTPPNEAVSSPVWSPDGLRIAFTAMPDKGDLGGEPARQGLMQRCIWVGTLGDDFQSKQLTDDPAYRDERPLWSADGGHMLFVRLDQSDRASLWLMEADGTGLRQVVSELSPAPPWFGFYGHIEWGKYFDWWAGTTATVLPVTGKVLPNPLPWFIAGVLALVASLGLRVWLRKPALP